MHEDQGSFNVCGLMDASIFEITCFGSGPVDEGPNQLTCPNECIKQDPAQITKKHYGLSTLTISCPNAMITAVGAVITKNWDGTILT